MPLAKEELRALEEVREVVIVTRDGDRRFRTVIWAAVDDDVAYLRSVRGEGGKWYQRVVGDPRITVVAGDFTIEATAIRADDPDSLERASAGFKRKYRGRSLDAMLLPHTLPTTLRLESAE